MSHLLVRSVSIVLAAAMASGAALAQTNAAPAASSTTDRKSEKSTPAALGEIIVTARKVEESVRDVPSTITALTSDAIEAVGPLDGTGDLLKTVPGVRFNSLQSENLAEVSIRGSGTERATSADSGVGLFVNGAYVGSSTLGGRNFKRIDYFDLQRVEVLEGPQGALYGRNSEFGTVNIVLNKPRFEDSGRIYANYTNELEQLRAEAVVNEQLGDNVAIRLGTQVTGQTDGFYYNPTQNKYYDHTDGYIARGQTRYSNGPLDVTVLVDAMDMNLPTFVNQWVLPPGQVAALPLGYFGPRYVVPQDTLNDLKQGVRRAMLLLDYDFGWGQLTSTSMTMHSKSRQHFSGNVDLATEGMFQSQGQIGFYPLTQTTTTAKNQTLYQDIHLGGNASNGNLQWLAGLEGLWQEDHYVRDSATSPCVLTSTSGICGGTPTTPICYLLTPNSVACPNPFPRPFGTQRVVPSKYDSYAIYGSLKYDIGKLSLTGELRYSHDYKKATQSDFLLYTTTPVGTPSTSSFDENTPSYSFTASYRFGDSLPTLVYAKIGSGYRAGGVNNGTYNANAPNPLRPSYDNETTVSYEIGLKSNISDYVFVRLSAYDARTSDAIASILDGCTLVNACGQAGTYFNINGGTAEVRGVEAQLDTIIPVGTGTLTFNVNGGYQDAKWVHVEQGIAGLPILNSPIAQTPDWTMSANLNYRQPIGSNTSGFLNVQYYGQRGGGQDTVTIATPFVELEDIDNVDLRVGFDYKKTTLAFFVKNLTDEIIPVLKLNSGTIPLVVRNSQPRTMGVDFTYRW